MSARTALDWGIVEKVVPAVELDAAVRIWTDAVTRSGPRARRLQKELIRGWEAMPINSTIGAGIRCISRAYQLDEPRQMVNNALARLKARKEESRASDVYGRLRCDPSQRGILLDPLQPQNETTPVSSASNFIGEKVEPLWDPSQNGCFPLLPQEHHQ